MVATVNEPASSNARLTHLQRLESEAIQIMREAVAEANNPAMLYSVGKDSSVMLHLAVKAFYPSTPPFPLVHVDTMWKFQEMYRFRDATAKRLGMELVVQLVLQHGEHLIEVRRLQQPQGEMMQALIFAIR